MDMTLDPILSLVGKLDDSPGDDTPRERFRDFLQSNVNEIGQVRDYIEECLRKTGDQYNRALQDLVNHLGRLLEFDVAFGRYKGVSGQIGFDGHWKSPAGFHIVVEVKTTEVYAIKTATLLNYVNELVSEKQIPNWGSALGLYVIGRPEPDIKQLENAIVAEKMGDQLRIISVESLLSLAEMMNQYDIGHQDVLAVIRPSGPTVDTVVDLMARLMAEPEEQELAETEKEPAGLSGTDKAAYWITPVKSDAEATAEEIIQRLVQKAGIYAFGERTPGRKHLKPGDWMCFYASGKGVVAHAQVISEPEKKPHPEVRHPDKYPWTFLMQDAELYLESPVVIDAALRKNLDAFEGRDPGKAWAWFVQATRKVSEHDFKVLTRQQTTS